MQGAMRGAACGACNAVRCLETLMRASTVRAASRQWQLATVSMPPVRAASRQWQLAKDASRRYAHMLPSRWPPHDQRILTLQVDTKAALRKGSIDATATVLSYWEVASALALSHCAELLGGGIGPSPQPLC